MFSAVTIYSRQTRAILGSLEIVDHLIDLLEEFTLFLNHYPVCFGILEFAEFSSDEAFNEKALFGLKFPVRPVNLLPREQ